MSDVFTVHDVQRTGRKINSVLRYDSLHQALKRLRLDPGLRPIAGGTDLLLDLQRGGPGEDVLLLDLTTIADFATITDAGDHWVLGGGVKHNQVVAHQELRRTALPLAQACLEIGSPQLRNRATIAGNLASASPANDSISALMALGASVELSSLGNDDEEEVIVRRMVDVADFFTGFRSTVLRPDELITAIHVPKLAEAESGIWVKLGLRRAQAISIVHLGLVIGRSADGTVTTARLALGSVAPTVVTVDAFGDALVGSQLTPESIGVAVEAAVDAIEPISDGRGTADYRRDGVAVMIERALETIEAGTEASMWPQNPPLLSSPEKLETVALVSPWATRAPVILSVNGANTAELGANLTLLDWVRDSAGLTGMKEGCAEGECGACTMLVDGVAVMSCLTLVKQVEYSEITTVEGLADNGELHPIQQSFVDDFAVQCGYCIPGFLVSGARLLDEIDDPSDEQIELALSGNLCRCTGYYPIKQAIKDSAVSIRAQRD